MKTAVIYARYSSDSQTEQSIEGQLRVCQEFAQRSDMVIVDTYIDRAMTGTNDNRPAFRKMIKDSAKQGFNFVIVYKLDRFSRNKFEMTMHKHTLKENGVKLVSAMENIPDTPEGIILESLLEGMNQYYSEELSQKVRRGMNETRHKGNFTGGTIIFGYKVINHKVVIDEPQAEIVRYIYEQYAMGVYVKDIITELTAKGILNRGKPFARNTIYNILKNEKYFGIFRHNEEVFENMYPRIVPQEIYDIVRSKIHKNQYGKRSTEVVYLLRHKLKCGYCSQPISAECGTAKNGEKKRYYKCLGRKRGSDCKKSMVRKDILENFVIEHVIQSLSSEKIQNQLVKGLLKLQDEQIKENSTLQYLKRELKQVELSIDNIMKAIEQGGTTNTVMNRLRELEDRQTTLERNLILEKSKITIRLTEKEIRQYYKQALELNPQMLINFLIKEIILFDDKMEIIYNSPLQISPDNSQGFSFYDKIVKMPSVIQNKPKPVLKDFRLIISV